MNLNFSDHESVVYCIDSITLNVNGLGDKDKWVELWNCTPKADLLLCFQETHLHTALEFAFRLYAQGYDFYFSHGTSNLAVVCTAMCRALGVNVVKLTDIPGRLLPLELSHDGITFRVLNIFALNEPSSQANFLSDVESYFAENTMLLGDFNSVT